MNCRPIYRESRAVLACLLALLLAAKPAHAESTPRAKHVVVVVFDGLRPDSVTEADMPTLYKLGHEGTFFAHHHPVYLSTTEVNGTALATGALPGHSGVMANDEYRPEIELLRPIGTQDLQAVRKGDERTNGMYLKMPTVAELVRAAGKRTVIAGTKPVALLLDRKAREANEAGAGVALFEGKTLPTAALADINAADGAFPKKADPTRDANRSQDQWTTRVLIERLWQHEIPEFTTLWMSEPDFAQHGSGPGSAPARMGLRSDDDNLAKVLAALDRAGVLDSTDIMVVSDHGFSTIARSVDIVAILRSAGFDAVKAFDQKPSDGQVMVVSLGGSTSFYVIGHEQKTTHRLVEFLQHSDFAGVIFTRSAMPGTFLLNQAGIETPDAPDVLVAMRWMDLVSQTGMPGMMISSSVKYQAGQGHHGSLGPSDMHNTLIASGPDFKRGYVDTLPSGNVDVAPTVLWLLGVKQSKPMDGRVLAEAMRDCDVAVPTPLVQKQEVELRFSDAIWRQYLRTVSMGNTFYCDQGNGSVETLRAAGQ